MNFFFINKWVVLIFLSIVTLIINFFSYSAIVPFLVLVMIILFFLRKKNFKNSSQEYVTDNIFFLPVSGIVKKIEVLDPRNISVLISSPFYKPWGIYAPSNCIISNLGFDKKKPLDKNYQVSSNSSESFEFINLESEDVEIEMRFLKRRKYNELVVNVDIGDQCSLGSNIGLFPLGGKLLLNISGDVKLNIKEGMSVYALETFLCRAN